MARIAIVDLLFRWPPDGGARVDIKEIGARLARHHEVRLYVPQHWMRLGRGQVEGDVGFPVEVVKLPKLAFDVPSALGPLVERVSAFHPDRVWVGDGLHLKPHLTLALARFRPILRLYAYELLCGRRYGVLFRQGSRCQGIDRLDGTDESWTRCRACSLSDARLLRSPSTLHELVAARAWGLPQRRAITDALAAASHVLVYNEEGKRRVLPFNANVRVVPSGVDCARYDGVAPVAAAASDGPTVFLASGRLHDPVKGGQILIEACDQLWARRHDFRLLVTGQASWTRPYLESLGWLDADALVAAHARCHVSVAPALWPEPFGIVAVEAMAAGRPVVASATGGLESIVADGETGLLVPPGNTVALAAALERLIEDRELVTRMGAAARMRAKLRFDWDAIYEREYGPLFGQ